MAEGSGHKPSKDNVISQQLVQNTYSRLKLKYASGLCEKWVEDTQPSKHVFEALSIAAFLIELWRSMYGIVPAEEREGLDKEETASSFVDIACGNGVLVYVLLMEGYQGWGFDACRRKTWTIFPESVQERLREEVYIPKPFADALSDSGTKKHMLDIGVKTHTGMFPKDAFIISHHADALTIWTPLMAALASPQSPLPFLAVPCCSHSLSGARYRYPPPKENATKPENEPNVEVAQNPQPASGDLRALRSAKLDAQTDAGMNKSMYGSLTAKAMRVTEEVGYEVEKTVLQIPSTRNLGVVGGRRRTTGNWNRKPSALASGDSLDRGSWDTVVEKVSEIVQRECSREGGVETAAKIWMVCAQGLHQGGQMH